MHHNFATLDNKQSQIHLNLSSVRVVLFVVNCAKIPVDKANSDDPDQTPH